MLGALTGGRSEGEAVHAGLVAPGLEVQRQPEGLAPPQHQPVSAQVCRVVVTAVSFQFQVTLLQNQLCGDSSRGMSYGGTLLPAVTTNYIPVVPRCRAPGFL